MQKFYGTPHFSKRQGPDFSFIVKSCCVIAGNAWKAGKFRHNVEPNLDANSIQLMQLRTTIKSIKSVIFFYL